MASIIQNDNTNLLKDPVASSAKECSCRQKSNWPLTEKCSSECLVYHAQVNRSDVNQTENYVTSEKISKSVTTTIPLLLEVKVNKKVQNYQNISVG